MESETVLITGNTYPVKAGLAALGGVWDPKAKGWRVPKEKEALAKALVDNAPVEEETRVCWECGCRFTWRDCKKSGGDWSDNYCGC